jgi:hypothetical protein
MKRGGISMNLMQRGTLVAAAAAAYLVGFWPSWWVRDLVLRAFNNPPYEGLWILISHLFLYTTLQALFCLAAWSFFARLQWMPALRLSPRLPTLGWGLGIGLLSIALLVAFFFSTGQGGAFHPPRPIRGSRRPTSSPIFMRSMYFAVSFSPRSPLRSAFGPLLFFQVSPSQRRTHSTRFHFKH